MIRYKDLWVPIRLHERCLPIAVLLFGLLFSFSVASSEAAEELEWQPCPLSGSDGGVVRYAECTTLERPLDPSGEIPGTITLAVARIRGESPKRPDDAVLAINGGPGGASRDMLVDLWPAFQALAADRDIIVMDQRGTGASSPLRCDSAAALDIHSPEAIAEEARKCIATLPHDPRFFTTSVAVTDFEALRIALGIRQWNVYGVSYGTRVAAYFARQYPTSTRSLILDSVVPPTLILGANVVTNSQEALEALDARCLEDPACKNTFGSVLAILKRLKSEWTEAVVVELPDPVTGKPEPVEVTYEHLAAVIRLLLYAPETAAIIPLIVHEAGRGNFLPTAAQGNLLLSRLSDSLSGAMHNSVVCTEDVPFFGAAEDAREVLDQTYLGAAMIDSLKAVCAVWPLGPMDDQLHEPLKSAIPTLLMAGELDPITPPYYAHQAQEGLTNARTLVVDGQGHSVLARGCVVRLTTEFLDTLQPKALLEDCLAYSPRLPPFIDMLGPAP